MKKFVKEDMGGVSAPISTIVNTPGMGNAVPGSSATNNIGSGDNWGNTINDKPYTQGKPLKKKTTKKKRVLKKKTINKKLKSTGLTKALVDESNVNPYDKIGQMMMKRMKNKSAFKKGKEKRNQNSVVQKKFEHTIITLDEFAESLNEAKDECYVDYLDSKNKFKSTRKKFKDHSTAWKWVLKNIDNPNEDFVKYLNEGKHSPKSQYNKDEDHLYMFTVYEKDGEKSHSDYYTLEDAKILKRILNDKRETFVTLKANMNDTSVDEINI